MLLHRRSGFCLTLLLVLCLAAVRPALAHPMGNFSINHYTKIVIEKDGITLRYFIDLAEIPTYQLLQQAGTAADDKASLARLLQEQAATLARGLSLTIDGDPVTLKVLSQDMILPPGAGGLPTMKMGFVFRAAYAAPGEHQLAYADNNYPGRAGWKEITVVGPEALVSRASAPPTDRSAELTNYPTDMLNTPPQVLTATALLRLPVVAAAVPAPRPQPLRRQALGPALPPVARPVARPTSHPINAGHSGPAASSTLPAGTAGAAGARLAAPVHLTPNRTSTPRDAFTELVTHADLSPWFLLTAAVIAFSLGGLHALEPGHGKTIVAAYLVGSRGTAKHAALLGLIVTASHTAAVFAIGAVTLYLSRYVVPEQLYPWLGVLSGLIIAVLGMYLFLRRWTGLGGHTHQPGQEHRHWFGSLRADLDERVDSVTRSDIGPLEPAAAAIESARKPLPLSQLFLLGITGGIIPCPAALVVLLSAFALHRVTFGFFLIVAFSVGLAAVLIGFGLLMVYARSFVGRLATDGPLTRRWLPLASSAFITVLGAAIAFRAAPTTGLSMSGVLHSLTPEKLGPALFVAGLGLVLGMRHSTDADHVVAVSTIVTRQKSVRGAAVIGALWGLGHTITIFLVGSAIILFKVVIPPRVGLSMEFSVALMLILLGVLNLTGVMQRLTSYFGRSSLAEAGAVRRATSSGPLRTLTQYGWFQTLRPLFIGLVHGLAGSAAVALLVLSTIHSPVWAILYLLVFGAGTLLGMACMTAAMALPLAYAGNRFAKISQYLGVASGLVSVCFGIFLVYQLGYLGGLFTSHPHWTPE